MTLIQARIQTAKSMPNHIFFSLKGVAGILHFWNQEFPYF
jgi:hypothetical protein